MLCVQRQMPCWVGDVLLHSGFSSSDLKKKMLIGLIFGGKR